jgi:hypothetical protein
MNPLVPLSRLYYSSGQLLSADDLRAEQDYLLARWRRHNRYLHGWGVVSGLAVSLVGDTQVLVQQGLAIDCAGNELVLGQAVTVALTAGPVRQHVLIQHTETLAAPVPTALGEVMHTRVTEGVQISVATSHPLAGHRGLGPGTPGCGAAHALCIATLVPGRSGLKVNRQHRRRSAR